MHQIKTEASNIGRGKRAADRCSNAVACTPLKMLPGSWDAPWDVLPESKQDMVREQ